MDYRCQTTEIALDKESIVVLGNFDGVHKGHQKLLMIAKEKAKLENRLTVALSFYPHPTWVLGSNPKPLIMSRLDRKNNIKSMGMDVFIEYPFTKQFASITPEEFFEEILIKQLKAKCIVVGQNYYFGKMKQGNVAYLRKLGEQHNVEIIAVDTVQKNGITISSTQIRQLILEGKIEEAMDQLGHPYTVIGRVIHGKKLGRTMGFPTINIIADPDRVYPPNGVYATRVKVYDKTYLGITNIGYNPTVANQIKMIETNIFDFNETIYGEEVEVAFYHFIRTEKKFESLDALYAQIQKDKGHAKKFFSTLISSLQA